MPTITDQRAGPKRKEGIQWTDFTANAFKLELPDGKRVNACVKISEGCRNCYSETMTNHWWPRSETEAGRTFPGFSLPLLQRGKPWLDTELLRKLLRWKPKPPFKSPDGRPKIFCFDMTDFFLDLWSDEFLDRFMGVVAIRTDIDFQILTKRAERMHRYITNWLRRQDGAESPTGTVKPLPNLWLGVSVENQEYADERIPILLRTPAAVRFVSYEPAIGPVDFSRFAWPLKWHWDAQYKTPEEAIDAGAYAERKPQALVSAGCQFIDWTIVGGESGHDARPFDIEWARNTIAQCNAAGVACFMKQCGARIRMPNDRLMEWGRQGDCVSPYDSEAPSCQGEVEDFFLEDSHGGIMAEWPDDLRVRQWPKVKV